MTFLIIAGVLFISAIGIFIYETKNATTFPDDKSFLHDDLDK